MLKLLRKKGVMKKLLWVVAVVIIFSFGIFGTANYLNRRRGVVSYAGSIFGRRISFDEFANALLHVRIQAVMRYGDNFNKIAKFLDLEAEAWDRLMLLHEANKRKIKVSDKEVVGKIADFEFLKRDGNFDRELYDRILRYAFRCRPRDFEEGIRETLIFAKLHEEETATVSISEEEVSNEYKNRNEKVRVSYALFSPGDYKNEVSLNPQETKEYFEQNKEDLRLAKLENLLCFVRNIL